jgi:hypothetical protein
MTKLLARSLYVLLLLTLQGSLSATEQSEATHAEKKEALETIQKWKSFSGTWEGKLHYTAAPVEAWLKQTTSVRFVFEDSGVKAYFQSGVRNWQDIAKTYRTLQPDKLTAIIHAYSAEGVWTENRVFVITRTSENVAKVYSQRVVNNWAGSSLTEDERVLSDVLVGTLSRE